MVRVGREQVREDIGRKVGKERVGEGWVGRAWRDGWGWRHGSRVWKE